jgi:hypothetical protein
MMGVRMEGEIGTTLNTKKTTTTIATADRTAITPHPPITQPHGKLFFGKGFSIPAPVFHSY